MLPCGSDPRAPRVSPCVTRRIREERRRQFVPLHCGSAAALSSVDFTPARSFSPFIFVAQRIAGAREILEAGPLAEAERSSEERKAASRLFEPTRRILELSDFAIQWPA